MHGHRFDVFVIEILIPIVIPFDGTNPRLVVIMANSSICHVELIETVTQAKPCSPDLYYWKKFSTK